MTVEFVLVFLSIFSHYINILSELAAAVCQCASEGRIIECYRPVHMEPLFMCDE